jgi:glycosyltransferase involved in cell wall biosynthesis
VSRVTVSVVMPAFDAVRYLREAIESVLHQTRSPVELIVVDDASTDDTAAVAASYGAPVRVVAADQRVRNIGGARNVGVGVSRGEVLAFLDADDYWERHWLELGLEALHAQPAPDLVFGRVVEFVSPDLDPAAAGALRPLVGDRPGHVAGATLVTRQTFERIGPFAAARFGNEYSDWFLRARDLGSTTTVVGEVTLHRRLHATNSTRGTSAMFGDHAVAIKASLDRRRARGQL